MRFEKRKEKKEKALLIYTQDRLKVTEQIYTEKHLGDHLVHPTQLRPVKRCHFNCTQCNKHLLRT